jgi:hypothetical protein
MDALRAIIVNAKEEDAMALWDAIEEYQTKYHRTWSSLRRVPFTQRLLDVIQEASADWLDENDTE